jgi:GNAT superfamily N-acetyltransferase
VKTLLTCRGNELDDSFYSQLNEASQREFGLLLPARSQIHDRLYFLLVETGTEVLLASGYLKPIAPVICDQETFSFLNIGGIIANEKGKGYGKQLMTAIVDHLIAHDTIGLGFCFPRNKGFYEKCGFTVKTRYTHRFIYRKGSERLTAEGQFLLYLDRSDHFLEQILTRGVHEVWVPDPTIW